MSHLSHTRVQVDKLVLERGAIYHGGILKADGVGAATVDLYDGLNTGGEPIDMFYAAVSQRDSRILERGLALREGLYVDIGSNVSYFTIYYEPVPKGSGEE